MAKKSTVTLSRAKIMKNSKKVTAPRTETDNINTVSRTADKCIAIDEAPAKAHSPRCLMRSHPVPNLRKKTMAFPMYI
ncbi:hypothetical protein OCU04_001930 [Sclerotinia nivalis]|uniref:Uncharacterized protein n=1 Tax=Sclerotinia nivalis TaxID=352851 RepID=A0A9X0AZ51_9HELO|nr:hypothetical protein OCU04_001930 [Sclerotinia nivalis]